jgi:hypothetical protein
VRSRRSSLRELSTIAYSERHGYEPICYEPYLSFTDLGCSILGEFTAELRLWRRVGAKTGRARLWDDSNEHRWDNVSQRRQDPLELVDS